MNCQEFEQNCFDLAAGRLKNARTCASLREHALVCEACAHRLAREQLLSAKLRELAASIEALSASPEQEAALLAAFRARRREAGEPPVIEILQPPRRLRLAVAAAALAAGIALVVLGWQFLHTPPSGDSRIAARETPKTEPVVGRSGIDEPSLVGAPLTPPTVALSPPGSMPGATQVRKVRASHWKGRRVLSARLSVTTNRSRGRAPEQAAPPEKSVGQEIATDFLPLAYCGDPSCLERGDIVRVKLPRSALNFFGLPVNHQAAAEGIDADVLISEDGIARAVRFVH